MSDFTIPYLEVELPLASLWSLEECVMLPSDSIFRVGKSGRSSTVSRVRVGLVTKGLTIC